MREKNPFQLKTRYMKNVYKIGMNQGLVGSQETKACFEFCVFI